MGNYSKKGDFKPGNNFGKGKPPLPDSLRAVQKLQKDVLERLIAKYLNLGLMELEEIAMTKIKTLPVIEAYLVAIIVEGLKSKNHAIMEWLMMRSIGKMKDDPSPEETQKTTHAELVKFFRERKEMLEARNINTVVL